MYFYTCIYNISLYISCYQLLCGFVMCKLNQVFIPTTFLYLMKSLFFSIFTSQKKVQVLPLLVRCVGTVRGHGLWCDVAGNVSHLTIWPVKLQPPFSLKYDPFWGKKKKKNNPWVFDLLIPLLCAWTRLVCVRALMHVAQQRMLTYCNPSSVNVGHC